MTDSALKAKIASRCEVLEEAFKLYKAEIVAFNRSQHYEFIDMSSDPSGLEISQHVLFDAVVHYFRDLNRYKTFNGFKNGELANPIKVGAFSTYWLSAKAPIFDTKNSAWAALVNDRFAMYAGLTLADIPAHEASLLADSRPYTQCMQLLSNKVGTPDSFVPIFELFKLLFTVKAPATLAQPGKGA